MKRFKLAATVAACALAPGAALAVDLEGGSVFLSYSAFEDRATGPDGEEERLARRTFGGSAELAIAGAFSVQADLQFHDFEFSEVDWRSSALHAIYDPTPTVALGAFVLHETYEGDDVELYGGEAAFVFGSGSAQAYFATGEYGGIEGDLAGLSGEIVVRNWLSFTADTQRADFDGGVTVERTALGATVGLGSVDLLVEAGQADLEMNGVTGSGAFFGVGAEYTFGRQNGTTFNARSLGALLPGG